jgi:hypothetical protein
MMQGAALIVGVGRTMVVMPTTVVQVMVAGVIGDVDAGGVFRDVLWGPPRRNQSCRGSPDEPPDSGRFLEGRKE